MFAPALLMACLLGCTAESSGKNDANSLWQDGMERGDLSAWSSFPGEETSFDSGRCERPPNGVTDGLAFEGDHALALRALTSRGVESGCRQFRFPEAEANAPHRFSFRLYLPYHYDIGYWAMVAQFKSRTPDGRNDALWSLQLQNRADGEMVFVLTFKCLCAGPAQGVYERDARGYNLQVFKQTETVVPARRWTLVEIDRLPSDGHAGKIEVRQDGDVLFSFEDIRTTYRGGRDSFALTAYGENVHGRDGNRWSPWFETVFDNVKIETIQNW